MLKLLVLILRDRERQRAPCVLKLKHSCSVVNCVYWFTPEYVFGQHHNCSDIVGFFLFVFCFFCYSNYAPSI